MTVKKLILALFIVLCALSVLFADSPAENSENTEEKTQFEERREKISYGLDSEIETLIDEIIKDGEFEYGDDLFALFSATRNQKLKTKIYDYCIAAKDYHLMTYALDILKDPMDEKRSMVNKVFEYVSALEIKDARESVLNLLFEEDGTYVEAAAKVIGKIGAAEDSAKLAEMLDSAVSENTKLYLISALGELNAVQSVSTIVNLAKDTSEPTAVRMAAAEALGGIESPESVESLISIYEDNDANVRVSVIKALSKKTDEKSKSVIISAVKDSFYKVRLAALQAIIDQNITDASSVVLYRAKNDAENVVKHKSYETLSAIHSAEGIWYLMNVIEDNKKSETDRGKAAAVLLKYNFDSSIEPVKAVARATLDDKRLIKLRYAIGKELAKYTSPAIEDICAAYLINDDVATKGTALDMFEKNNFESLKPLVEVMSVDDKEGTNKKKAKNVLDRIERNGTPLTKSSD